MKQIERLRILQRNLEAELYFLDFSDLQRHIKKKESKRIKDLMTIVQDRIRLLRQRKSDHEKLPVISDGKMYTQKDTFYLNSAANIKKKKTLENVGELFNF